MDRTWLKALYIILTSLAIGFVFNFLFFGKPIGISVFIFTLVFTGAALLLSRSQKIHIDKVWWLVLLILFFGLMPSIRASLFLNFLNICAALGLLMLLAHQLVGTPAWVMKLRDYLVLIIIVPFRMIARGLSTISSLGQVHSSVKNRDIWLRVIKGVIMAIPILFVFAILFSKADLAFAQFLKSFINISISESTAQHLFLLVVTSTATLCFLSYILFPKPPKALPLAEPTEPMLPSNKGVEMLVFLGLIAVLFLVFIGFQVTYLFGGQTNIIHAGFTYAEYARRGFWELLVVAVLSLLLLLSAEKYSGSEAKRNWQFLTPALVLIAEVIVVIVSAYKRLSLYIDAYSMTTMRFYVAGFIMLLLGLFILLAVKFITSKREQFFTFGTLLCAAAFLIIVNVINPDAFIVRSNLKQYDQTGKIDASYVGRLSSDAIAGQMELYSKLQGDDKDTLQYYLQRQKSQLETTTAWQSANRSRNRAWKLLQDFK